MIRHITAEDIFHLAIRTIEMGTDENFVEFSHTLQSWSDHFQDFISAFRALHFVKTRLYILQFSDSKQLHRSQILTSYIDTELELLLHHPETFENVPSTTFRWTGTLVELVELIYGMQEMRCIDDGDAPINELFAFFGSQFGLEIKVRNCYDTYLDIKRRKNDSRTYFLDKMRERLNLRMQRDDEKERMRR
ncbi:MAG: RteC domain-containing protein [Rikenellaceae bacterium]|nr:RteC domain-containing protein [Rikenellaceae bacterium]